LKKETTHSSKAGWQNTGLFFLFFAVFLLILHGLPLSLDDYGFRDTNFESVSQALQYVLRFGNGRFLGNGGIVFLMHHLVLGDWIRAAVLAGIAVLLPGVLSLHRLPVRLLSMFLFLTISPGIFGQVYSWMSGFQNYVPPLLLLLITILLIRGSDSGSPFANVCRCLLIFLFSLCMQFYIEHSSCLNVLTALLLTIWLKKEKDPRFPASLLFLIGSLIGIVLMFVAMFFVASEVHGGVQSYFTGGFFGVIRGLLRNTVLLLSMYSENAAALCLMAGLCAVFLSQHPDAFTKRKRQLAYYGMLMPSGIFLLSLIGSVKPFYGKLAMAESILLLIAMFVYMFSVLYVLICLARHTGRKNIFRAAVLFALALAAILPILAVWPTGYRCLFHSCVMLFGAELVLAEEVLEWVERPNMTKIISAAMTAILTAAVLCQTAVFTDIRRMDSIREAYLEEQAQQGADSVVLFSIPSPYIHEVWNGDSDHYTTINGRQIQLSVLPADVWFRMYYYHYT